ncbi:MAG TPA: nucleoside hydrolase-like domain-containing protein [Chryseolinea sp.]
MKKRKELVFIIICLFGMIGQGAGQSTKIKHRTIITTDGEVDDQDSFIRFLLYTNEFDVAGLVYSSSQWHYAGDGKGTAYRSEMEMTSKRYGERTELRWPGTEWMQHFIGLYGKVYDNLLKHDKGYPSPGDLLSKVKVGNIIFEGDMSTPTEGSDFIKNVLLDERNDPVYLQIWGGTNTVARALKSIEEEYKRTPEWNSIYAKVSAKAVLYAVLDQDATYRNYVAPSWPEIKVIYNSNQFWCFAYPWPKVVPQRLQSYLRGPWFTKNITQNHGPLLAGYFLYGDGQTIPGDPEHTHGSPAEAKKIGFGQYDFISEGDSPAYFYLLDVGLRSLEDASYGGWGGRFNQSEKNAYRWEDGEASADFNPYTNKMDASYSQTRWVDVLQNDFAARADWCVTEYNAANHAPVVSVSHPLDLNVKPGQTVLLNGTAKDPDNNSLNYKWWQYEEPGTHKGKISIMNSEKADASFVVPQSARPGSTIHIIFEVTDNGTPGLTRYQRVIATVAN